MSTYLPAVFSTVRTDGLDRKIDRMFDEALRTFGTAEGAWVPACNAWEDSTDSTFRWPFPAGSRKTSPWK
jgi:hypothetical protein